MKKLKTSMSKLQLKKKYSTDAGYDICSAETVCIPPKSDILINTDLYIALDTGTVGLVRARSGISINNQIEVGAGVIDADFRGEVKVHLYNLGVNDFHIERGDRIAQLLVLPFISETFYEVDKLPETYRNTNGFGSTGK